MSNKYLFLINKLNTKSWIKYWLFKKNIPIQLVELLRQATPITLTNTISRPFVKLILYGKTIQDGIPTPELPVEITNVTGDVEVVVSNADNTKQQTVTFPLGNEKLMIEDYLDDDGIHHKRKSITLNGTENIGVYIHDAILSNMYAFYILNIEGAFANSKILSSHFIFGTLFNNEESRVYSYVKNTLFFIIPKTIASTVDEVKTYLAEQYANGTPVIVEYELEQEVIVPYTSAQQAQWNSKKKMQTYNEQTNIDIISNTGSLDIDVSYYQKGE